MLNTWGEIIFDSGYKPLERGSSLYQEGQDEAVKDQIKQKTQNEEKLNKLVLNSNYVLYSSRTIFPFTFFPDAIIVTLNDVSIVYGEFFVSKQIRSVAVSKIAEVIVETGFFFATLKIIDKDFSQITMEINYLTIKDAMKVKRLIQGLIFANKEGIDITKIEDVNLAEKLEDLGRVTGEKLDES